MALDKLVDSAQLDADLEDVADAIRAKGGTSAQLAFPAGFVSAIGDIQTGGGEIQLRGNLYFDTDSGLTNPVKVKSYKYAAFSCAMTYANSTLGGVIFDLSGDATNGFNCIVGSFNTANNAGALIKIISSDGTGWMHISNGGQCFRGQTRLEEISCRVTTDALTAADRTFTNCTALKYINFVPDRCQMPLPLGNSSALTDAGLVAIANGLKGGDAKTVTLHATPKARCAQIVGTVSQVTDDSGTYDFFTADAGGTVTLTDFITNTKGWTLA